MMKVIGLHPRKVHKLGKQLDDKVGYKVVGKVDPTTGTHLGYFYYGTKYGKWTCKLKSKDLEMVVKYPCLHFYAKVINSILAASGKQVKVKNKVFCLPHSPATLIKLYNLDPRVICTHVYESAAKLEDTTVTTVVKPSKLTGFIELIADKLAYNFVNGTEIEIPGPTYNLFNHVRLFYLMLELCVENESLTAKRDVFVSHVSRIMFDYLAVIVFGEARHASGVKWNWPGELSWVGTYSRDVVYNKCTQYDIKQALPLIYRIYKDVTWNGSFGGAPWANITKAAMAYLTMPSKTAWLDHVVDISHHGGLAFNKGVFWIPPANNSSYKKFLDWRMANSVLDYADLSFDRETIRWLMWFTGILPSHSTVWPGLKWGDKELIVYANMDNLNGHKSEFEEDEKEETDRESVYKRPRFETME